jgi:tRNA(Ile2) C34 agmatinyltransferase TiaS
MKDPLRIRCKHCGKTEGSHNKTPRGNICPGGYKVYRPAEKHVRVTFIITNDPEKLK